MTTKNWARTLAETPKRLLNANFDPTLDALCDRLEFLFSPLERFIPALRKETRRVALSPELFSDAARRERFIPIRRAAISERLVADAASETERFARQTFVKMIAARFHFDFLRRTERLENDFAPFDSDSDARFFEKISSDETRARGDRFFSEMQTFLADCNFFEIPQTELARCLNLRRPGAPPVVARYDDFDEYRVFARGVVPSTTVRFPRWKAGGRRVEIESETLSRVCVLARLKKNADSALFASSENASTDERENADAAIVVKLFKNVALEDLKLIAPSVELTFPIFDGIKIGGSFIGGLATAAAKLFLAATITLVGFVVALFGFVLATVKSAFGFLNRRTAYMQKYSKALFFKNLASNRAAIALLVQMAEDQEIKEFLIGYFAARNAQKANESGWTTEREIDAEAERWLAANFNLKIDFESADALRKLREKRLVEIKDAEEPTLYRVFDLQDALRRLDADWDAFFSPDALF